MDAVTLAVLAVIIALVFILNNLAWLVFVYLILPRESKKPVKFALPTINRVEKDATTNPLEDMMKNAEDLNEVDPALVFASQGITRG